MKRLLGMSDPSSLNMLKELQEFILFENFISSHQEVFFQIIVLHFFDRSDWKIYTYLMEYISKPEENQPSINIKLTHSYSTILLFYLNQIVHSI